MTSNQNQSSKKSLKEIIHPYGEKKKSRRGFTGKGRTKQSFKAECDINNILKKYQKSGAITHANMNAPDYGFASSQTFTDAMQTVAKAQTMFNELPSSLRNRFSGNPGEFLDFVQDPENEAEMAELGLLASYTPAEPTSEASVASATPPASSGPPEANPPSGTPGG